MAYVVTRLSGLELEKVKGNVELGSGVIRGFKGPEDIFRVLVKAFGVVDLLQ
jgi:hypothetical protein